MNHAFSPAWERPPLLASFEDDAAPGVPRAIVLGFLALSFAMGLLNHFTVRLVGLMPVNELLLGGLLAFAVLWIALYQRLPVPLPAPRILLVLLFCQTIGLISYIVADLWRDSYTGDMIRGWSRMIFLMINIGGFSLLFGASTRCFAALQIGLVFSFIEALIHGPLFGDYWKFGFAYPITTLVLLLAPRFLGVLGSVLACLSLGAVHAVMDFRSFGGICLVIGGLLTLRLLSPIVRKTLLITGAIIALAAFPWAAKKALGDTGARGTRSNVERSAMLQASWEGFLQSPIIGQGSWFSRSQVLDEFLLIRTENSQLAGVGGFDETALDGVTIHSQILVALAEGGFFGASFFFAYGALILWGVWYCLAVAPWSWLLPTQLFTLFIAFWNLLMSPFSGPHRVEIAMAVGLLLLLWQESGRLREQRRAARAEPLSEPA